MSTPEPRHSRGEDTATVLEGGLDSTTTHAPDGVEGIVHAMPIVLPVMGGLLMFLLAFIAIYVA
jgi:hypothetical protein